MDRRTVLRSSPTRRAIAEMLTPCRCSSRIMTISPSRTNDASPEAEKRTSSLIGTGCSRGTSRLTPSAAPGEFSTGASGDYSGSPALCVLLVVISASREHIRKPYPFYREPLLSKRALPLIPAGLVVDQVLPTPDHVTIFVRPRQEHSPCPTCACVSTRAHSRYQRKLGDLP